MPLTPAPTPLPKGWFGVMVLLFNATFNYLSAISWWSVLLVEETAVPGENHRPAKSLTNFIT
jgi:hypothetical protein